ncbi:MAG: hypothetical protein ACK559_14305 [bacterium]
MHVGPSFATLPLGAQNIGLGQWLIESAIPGRTVEVDPELKIDRPIAE